MRLTTNMPIACKQAPTFVMPLAYWVHDLSPFLIQFSENFGIRYYGLAYLAGFVGAAWLLHLSWRKGRSPFELSRIMDLMTYIVLGVLIGGRLGSFLLYKPEDMFDPPWAIFMVWKGGMASHGGFVGVLAALWWWARKEKVPMLTVSDVVVPTVPLGLLFGRIANFINGELYGKITGVAWAVIFPQSAPPGTPIADIPPRHPSQIYQAALEGLLLLIYMQWRFWRSDAARERPGQLSGEFLIGYAILRMIGEIFREPDATLILGLSRGTFYSVFLIVAGAWLIARARAKTSNR
jgi:phosphatidylglycerol---prolipoprotein diacylglyceryl transferase